MRVQHNIMAMGAYRNYTNNVSAMKKNLERLSSGYKINRAGDDAAGLAISEKMRAQITGLETAQKNAKDGISLVQTAEGALTEVHDMLNRMVELATMSANGTYDNSTDRVQLQKEMNQLKAEINRIADGANFNGIQLLDGSMDTSVKVTGETDIKGITGALTVLADGQLGNDATAGVFEFDLTNFTATASADNSKPTLKIFGQTITITKGGDGSTAFSKGETVTADDIIKSFMREGAWNVKGNNGTGFSAYGTATGFEMKAEANGDKIIFTMNKAPSAKWDFDAAVSWSNLTAGDAGTDAAYGNQAMDVRVKTLVEPIDSSSARKYAQAKIDLTKLSIVDGTTLTIGDTTYTFAVGRNSKYKDADNIIDLTDQTGAIDTKVAAVRITTAAQNNRNFKVSNNSALGGAGESNIYLTEKEGGVDTTNYKLEGKANTTQATSKDGDWSGLIKVGSVDTTKMGKGLMLQIGDTAASYNQLKVSISDCHTAAIGIDGLSIADQESAQAAVDAIKDAINYVSDVRGTLGATQNRLDHTINNLSVMTENIQDAESTIRDTDIAEEMMAYTKNNILIQASQAMLAQANQVPQGVLQLLQ